MSHKYKIGFYVENSITHNTNVSQKPTDIKLIYNMDMYIYNRTSFIISIPAVPLPRPTLE